MFSKYSKCFISVIVLAWLLIVSNCAENENETMIRNRIKRSDNSVKQIFYNRYATVNEKAVLERKRLIFKLCTHALTVMVSYCDQKQFNVDFVFYLADDGDAEWYPYADDVDKLLMTQHIPRDIKPLDEAFRQSAIAQFCNRLGDKHARYSLNVDHFALRPYTVKGFIYVTTMNLVLKPYFVVDPVYYDYVASCSEQLKDVVSHFKRHHVNLVELTKHILGVDPDFSLTKWCTIGIHQMVNRLEIARNDYFKRVGNASLKIDGYTIRPKYNFLKFPLVTPENLKESLTEKILGAIHKSLAVLKN